MFLLLLRVLLEGREPSVLHVSGNIVKSSLQLLGYESDEPIECVRFSATYFVTDVAPACWPILFNNSPVPVRFVVILNDAAEGQLHSQLKHLPALLCWSLNVSCCSCIKKESNLRCCTSVLQCVYGYLAEITGIFLSDYSAQLHILYSHHFCYSLRDLRKATFDSRPLVKMYNFVCLCCMSGPWYQWTGPAKWCCFDGHSPAKPRKTQTVREDSNVLQVQPQVREFIANYNVFCYFNDLRVACSSNS